MRSKTIIFRSRERACGPLPAALRLRRVSSAARKDAAFWYFMDWPVRVRPRQAF
jgi:hypothetical protein